MPTAMRVSTRTMWVVSRSRGEGVWRISWESCASLPNSVRRPVAKTTASPLPRNTLQPAKATLSLSASRLSTAADRSSRGLASPVRGALFTVRSVPCTRRASAGMRSPSAIISRSPGTSSSLRMRWGRLSRVTSTCCGRNFCSASMAFSARYSWRKLKPALRRATPASAQPRTFMLSPGWRRSATKQIPAEKRSSRVKKLVNCRPSWRSHFQGSGISTLLGPTSSRRSATSFSVSPSGRLPRDSYTSSGASCWICRAVPFIPGRSPRRRGCAAAPVPKDRPPRAATAGKAWSAGRPREEPPGT